MKKVLGLLLVCFLCLPIQINARPAYKSAYEKVLKQPDKYIKGKLGTYYKRYVGEKFKGSKYFTYDIDKNGIPELLIQGNAKNKDVTLIFTYSKKKVVCKGIDNYYGITKNYIISKDVEHGNESYIIRSIKGKKKRIYISHIGKKYRVKINKKGKKKHLKKEYNHYYSQYVKPAKKFDTFTKYSMNNTSGIK